MNSEELKQKLNKAIMEATEAASRKGIKEQDLINYKPSEKCLETSFFMVLLRREEFLFLLNKLPKPPLEDLREVRAYNNSCLLLGFACFEATLRYVNLWFVHKIENTNKVLNEKDKIALLKDKGGLNQRIKDTIKVFNTYYPNDSPLNLEQEFFAELDKLVEARNLLTHKNYEVDLRSNTTKFPAYMIDYPKDLNNLYTEFFQKINDLLSISSQSYQEKCSDGIERSFNFKSLFEADFNTFLP